MMMMMMLRIGKMLEDCGCSTFVDQNMRKRTRSQWVRLYEAKGVRILKYTIFLLLPAICECAYQNHIKLVLC